MKRQFQFHFVDEPQFATAESRAAMANAFRAFRRHRDRYEFKRIAPHTYTVRVRQSSALGIFAARIS